MTTSCAHPVDSRGTLECLEKWKTKHSFAVPLHSTAHEGFPYLSKPVCGFLLPVEGRPHLAYPNLKLGKIGVGDREKRYLKMLGIFVVAVEVRRG